jgi:hypothetical protein
MDKVQIENLAPKLDYGVKVNCGKFADLLAAVKAVTSETDG